MGALTRGLRAAEAHAIPAAKREFTVNTSWLLAGQVLRITTQAAYFVVIARALGPFEYGAFVAVTAAAAILAPFIGIGCGNLLIKSVSRDPRSFADYWGTGLAMTIGTGVITCGLLAAVSRLIFSHSVGIRTVLLVATSDLVMFRVAEMAGYGFQALDRLKATAVLSFAVPMGRLMGMVLVFALGLRVTIAAWAGVYFIASTIPAALSVVWLSRMHGKPSLSLTLMRRDIREGFYFAVSASSFSIYTDIDKTMLARLSYLDAAGTYAAAYRFIDLGFMPVRSVLNAAYSTMFRKGTSGLTGTVRYASHLMKHVWWYPACTSLLLFAFAPVVVRVLGTEFRQTADAIRWLAVIPLFKTFQFFAADALTGAGYQGVRTALQAGDAVLNVGLNLLLIRCWAWRGAAWASLASDAALAISLWGCALMLKRKETSGRAILASVSQGKCPR